jgi:hypothetical protein
MRANRLFLGLALAATTGISACGTIIDGGTQIVDVVVKGSPTAYCEFTTMHFRNAASFPNKMTIERSREALHADCRGEQNRHVAFDIPSRMTAAGSVGNVPTGVAPGMGYDAMTGGMWEYPNPIIVDFREVGESAKPEWPENKADENDAAARIGTATIAAPQPVRMQPVMDEDVNPAMSMAPGRLSAPVVHATTVVTTTSAPQSVVTRSMMAPVTSPEDKMGLEPGQVKAQADARRKAKEEAARKAKEDADAKKRADAEAKKAAEEAKMTPAPASPEPAATTPAATLPETTSTPPADAPATTTTTTTTTTAPAPEAPAAEPVPATTTTTTTTTTPAPASEAPKDDDINKYLQGQ